MAIIKFHYSKPYESALAQLRGEELSKDHSQKAEHLVELVQNLWEKYENQIIKLFEEMYRIKIDENKISAWISLIAPNSYSDPLTFSLIRYEDKIEDNIITQRGFIFNVIHELAHYFAYTRPDNSFFNNLWEKVKEKNLVGGRGGNLHYLIQATEFGLGAEVLGENPAINRRKFIIEHIPGEYGESAKLLLEHKVPLNKNCLEYIERKILK